MSYNIVFRAPTPDFFLEHIGTSQAGRCYTISKFKVTSIQKVPHAVFDSLRAAGCLGYGQGWSVSSPLEEKQLLIPVSLDSSGRVVSQGYDQVINPYSNEPYKESYRTIYVYTITSECDSSD